MPENKSGLTQIFEHVWSTDDWLIAQLGVPLEDIAARNGLVVQTWTEDGLGLMSGCLGRLPSGVIIKLVESRHLVSYRKAKGPAVYADAVDVNRLGIENLISQVAKALDLKVADIEGRNSAPTTNEVEFFQRRSAEMRARTIEGGVAESKE